MDASKNQGLERSEMNPILISTLTHSFKRLKEKNPKPQNPKMLYIHVLNEKKIK
jgi:hypothetical protein